MIHFELHQWRVSHQLVGVDEKDRVGELDIWP